MILKNKKKEILQIVDISQQIMCEVVSGEK